MREKFFGRSKKEKGDPSVEKLSRRDILSTMVGLAGAGVLAATVLKEKSRPEKPPIAESDPFLRTYEPLEINGRRIEFIGVSHVPRTIKQYRSELAVAIESAGAVILEYAPSITGVLREEDITFAVAQLEKIFKEKNIQISRDGIINLYTIKAKEENTFYETLVGMIRDAGKPFAYVDPVPDERATTKTEKIRRNTEIAKGLVTLGSGLGALGVAAKNELDKRKTQKSTEKNETVEVQDKTTRRKVLQGLLGGLATASTLSLLASADRSSEDSKGLGHRKDNLLGALVYNRQDYRDVISAEGIDALARQEKLPDGPIVVIYGDGHVPSQRHYLRSPKERAARSAAYAPFRSISDPKLEVFEPTLDGWKKVLEQKL